MTDQNQTEPTTATAAATADPVARIAARLGEALRAARPVEPVTPELADLAQAYDVQEALVGSLESAANPRVGRKVGLTAPAVQRQLGVDQPDFGVLLADMDRSAAGTVDADELIAPKIEAEVAFVLRRDVTDASREAVVDAIGGVAAALEIVDSRIADWRIGIRDTVADNASSARFVVSPTVVPLADVVPAEVDMRLESNGETVSEGNGAACLGDPITALVWVAETAIALGRPLRAGEVVLSGALGPMVPIAAGDDITAHITGLGDVSVRIEGGRG